MSSSISYVAFVRPNPAVSLTTSGRVRVRLGEDTCVIFSPDHARSLMQDIESALLRLGIRDDKFEIPLGD